MGVALENARLFDETQRLLKETERRNAELAVINSIQQAVSAALDFQAIVDVVGDKLREVLRHRRHEHPLVGRGLAAGAVALFLRARRRLPHSTVRLEPGTLPYRFYQRRSRVVVGSIEEQLADGRGSLPGTDRSKSMLAVPMLAGDRMLGSVHLENHERDHAFGRRGAPAGDHRRQHERGAGERPPVRRDPAPARRKPSSATPSWR